MSCHLQNLLQLHSYLTYAAYLAFERDDLSEHRGARHHTTDRGAKHENTDRSKTGGERERERETPAAAAGAAAGIGSARASAMLPIVVALSFTTARTALPHTSLTVSLILIAK